MSAARTRLEPLVDVMNDAREGVPRWLTIDGHGCDVTALVRRAAVDADAHGFVPLAVDSYLHLGADAAAAIDDRTLLLIARPGTADVDSRAALFLAAARSPRPHVLLAITQARAGEPSRVREARVAYGVAASEYMPEDVRRIVQRASRAAELRRTGCHAAAERLLRDTGAALARRRAWLPAASVHRMLGELLLERGRVGDAIAVFDEAAKLAACGNDGASTAECRVWQAAARIDAGQLVAAEAQCRAVAAASISGPPRAYADATLARTLLWQRRLDEAAEIADRYLGNEPTTSTYVVSIWIRVLLARGAVFDAGQLARAAVDRSEASEDPLEKVLAHGAHARVLMATGDRALADRAVETLARVARQARTPLRLARIRLLRAELFGGAAARETARETAWLRRLRAAAPPLLRSAIDRILTDGAGLGSRRSPGTAALTAANAAAPALIALAREEEDDRRAVERLLQAAADTLRPTRIDLHSRDAGPASAIVTLGSGPPASLASRVLDAGIPIGPEPADRGCELGVPVRLGTTLLAALAARWPADRPAPAHGRALLELTAAVAAPRIESLLASRRDEAAASLAVPELVGRSRGVTELRKAIARAASAPFAVLIEGESGVGKELVARAVHQLGPRRERRFCDVNCAALPDDLLESELFGHARGAFTGAIADRPGLFEDADGGTLFLDEVADLSARAQAKLLRVIQQQEVRRVGETFTRPVDVRIVAAANRDMRAEAAGGRFRQDLLYRLDVIRITIPPLRERPDDVAALAAHFWKAASARVASTAVLSHGVLSALARYEWPGNVRELQNVIAALAVAAPARGAVRPHLLPAAIAGAAVSRPATLSDARIDFERRFVAAALARAGGSRTRAARELAISRQGLLKILSRLGLE